MTDTVVAQDKPADSFSSFVDYIIELVEGTNTGPAAALRSAIGRSASEALRAAPYVEPWLAGASDSRSKAYYAIAGMLAKYYVRGRAERVGRSFRIVAEATKSQDSFERQLLVMARGDLDVAIARLPRLLSRAKDEGVPIDWVRLLRSLTFWNTSETAPSVLWLKDYYRYIEPIPSEETSNK